MIVCEWYAVCDCCGKRSDGFASRKAMQSALFDAPAGARFRWYWNQPGTQGKPLECAGCWTKRMVRDAEARETREGGE